MALAVLHTLSRNWRALISDFRLIGLLPSQSALWVDKLVRCRVVSLPIAGAVHITSCNGCQFHVASRQIRIHQTVGTDFYLHAGSHPIIEVRLAPPLCSPCSTTVFSHAQTVVICGSCSTVLCQPTGGKARLTEGCSFRKKSD
jgi:small subunit ribosomal protein S27e